MVFTEESWFGLVQHKRWAWQRHDDYSADVCHIKQAHPTKVMMCGAARHNIEGRSTSSGAQSTGSIIIATRS
jgi:hypothetical protein